MLGSSFGRSISSLASRVRNGLVRTSSHCRSHSPSLWYGCSVILPPFSRWITRSKRKAAYRLGQMIEDNERIIH